MTDREMIKLCADAMGIRVQLLAPETGFPSCDYYVIPTESEEMNPVWNPLEDDAQAMSLVKRFELSTDRAGGYWYADKYGGGVSSFDADSLNRAIVGCVAKMDGNKCLNS